MRVTIQRVSEASVKINQDIKSHIGKGLVVFLGIGEADIRDDIEWLCKKIIALRIFSDEHAKMNKSLIGQFTLFASTRKGNRPSYINSAQPDIAFPLYVEFHKYLEKLLGKQIATGKFGADMKVSLCNDGPVTINIDSKKRE